MPSLEILSRIASTFSKTGTAADFLPDLKRQHKTEGKPVVRDLRQRSREIFGALGERTVRVQPTVPFLVKTHA